VEAQVLLGRQVLVEGGVLEDQADVAADLVPLPGDVVAGHARRPAAGGEQRAQDLDGGGLARPVGPQEPEGLAGRDLEVDAPHRLDGAEALAEAVHHHRRAAVHSSSSALSPSASSR
jgi:hypothetical protein